MSDSCIRVAMWSGPRNISTAMLRSWGSRPNTIVCDEPLYAHYLKKNEAAAHPGRQETLAHHAADWRKVVASLTGPVPPGTHVFYQKHMAHHLMPEIELDWVEQLTNCFLIRQPRGMLASLLEFLPDPTLADTGLPQQVELYHRLVQLPDQPCPIIDGRDVIENPREMLGQLCDAIGVPFDEAMLSWEPGPRPTDGAWGPFWYAKVYQTTSFGRVGPPVTDLPARLEPLARQCESLYEELAAHKLTPPA
jgi:hypothetical protein